VARPLRVGIQLPEVEREVRWPEVAAIARAAEEAGFDSIWLGDHLLYRGDGRRERGPWDVWTQLAALAAVTERVALGPLVACTAFHPPGLLARMAASVDEVSGGRIVLGIGAGWNEVEFRAFGIPNDRRVSRFEEAFEIVRRLLAGEQVTFSGDFYSVDDAVLPPPARRVPLMLGAHGERMLAAGLPHVDAWNTWFEQYGNEPARFAELNARVDAAALRAGRDPREIERSACLLVSVGYRGVDERLSVERLPAVPVERLDDALRELAEGGADEAILVAVPITAASIRSLGAALPR
jgi:alkanesulfonate monooxygenase SsuD/methylene tetrahydromethanopterin reductase-like flavin-dependent oxidoreductase (luciferase family)